jgi:hypothetical protein
VSRNEISEEIDFDRVVRFRPVEDRFHKWRWPSCADARFRTMKTLVGGFLARIASHGDRQPKKSIDQLPDRLWSRKEPKRAFVLLRAVDVQDSGGEQPIVVNPYFGQKLSWPEGKFKAPFYALSQS